MQAIRFGRKPWGAVLSVGIMMALGAAVPPLQAQGVMTTMAGNGVAGFSGDGGSAIGASLNEVFGVGIDGAGNFYIADRRNHRIRMVNSNGVITTIAGIGISGYGGDGGPAVAATFNDITGISVDAGGTVYVADAGNRRIRRISNGIVTTFAGTGVQGFSGDGGAAVNAQLNRPSGVFADQSGNVFIADSSNHRVRRVGSDGVIFTVAGNGAAGFSGDGGPATAASLATPVGMSVDAQGNLYIADADNHRIRRVGTDGNISTVAGNGSGGFSGDGGPATSARLNFPSDVVADGGGFIFIADASNNRIRRVANGIITTTAGTGSDSFSGDGGAGPSAAVNFPYRVTLGSPGSLLIADTRNYRVRRLSGVATALPTPNPTLPANPAVNGATFQAGAAIAPGAIISIFGSNFAAGSAGASTVPLPTSLLGTSVMIQGVAAPLFFMSSGQINAQVPFTVQPGPITIEVRRGSTSSGIQTANVALTAPGIFTINQQGNGQGAILSGGGQLVDATAAAGAGEVVQVFLTGLGATTPAVATGQRAPSAEPLARTTAPVSATVGGVPAEVQFAGLAPGFVGLYQVNVRIPGGVPAGANVPIVITQSGASSNTATLAIR